MEQAASSQRRNLFRIWSGRWESNPRPKLGKLNLTRKNARIGGILTFFENFRWIPIGAAWLGQVDEEWLGKPTHSPKEQPIHSYNAMMMMFTGLGVVAAVHALLCCHPRITAPEGIGWSAHKFATTLTEVVFGEIFVRPNVG